MLAAKQEKIPPSRLLGRLLFLLLAIVGAIAFYYFVLLERGTEHVSRRNFRTLAQFENQIQTGFERIRAVANVQDIKEKPLHVADRTYIAYENSGYCKAPDNGQPYATLEQPISYRLMYSGDGAVFNLCIQTTPLNTTEDPAPGSLIDVHNVRLADLIDFNTSRGQFQQVLIFDSERRLALRSSSKAGAPGNNATTHEALVAIPDSWIGQEDIKKSGINLGTDKKDSDKKEKTEDSKTGKPEPTKVQAFTKVQRLTIGGEEYRVFIRPLPMPYPDAKHPDQPAIWYAVGITTESAFNASRFMMPRWQVSIMVLVLLVLACSLPYIKLKLLGPRDLIRSGNILGSSIGLILGMILSVIMVLNLISYYVTEEKMSTGLVAIGKLMTHEIDTEYRRRAEALDKLSTSIKCPLADMKFDRLSVVTDNGRILRVLPEHSVDVKPYTIDDRDYWNRLGDSSSLSDAQPRAYTQETLYSKLDGSKRTILAMRSRSPLSDCVETWKKIPEDAPNEPASVLTGAFRYALFDRIVLPKGFGFIVIDNSSGVVQYHSEEQANTIEQLFEETDNNAILRSAIELREKRTLVTNYRGQSFLFSTHPLAYPQWTLITFFNGELLDRTNFGLLLTATGLSCAYLFILAAALLASFKLFSNTKINHLWPNARQAPDYLNLLMVLIAIAIAETIAISTLHASELLKLLAASPVLAIAASYICLVRRYRHFRPIDLRRKWQRGWRATLLQSVALAALLVFVSSFVLSGSDLTFSVAGLAAAGAAIVIAAWIYRSARSSQLITGPKLAPKTDRRADRDAAHTLHRYCLALLVTICALLPTLAFFRDTTALYVMRWLQEDSYEIRHQLERKADDPKLFGTAGQTYGQRIQNLIDANEQYGLFTANPSETPCSASLDSIRTYKPELVAGNDLPGNSMLAVKTVMWPVLSVEAALSASIILPTLRSNDDFYERFKDWRRCTPLDRKEFVSILPIPRDRPLDSADRHLRQSWPYSEIGLLQWPWLWSCAALTLVLAICPMVRRVLRELAPEGDLRTHPELSRTELDLLYHGWHGIVVLINPSAMRREAHQTLIDQENRVVEMLSNKFKHLNVTRLAEAIATIRTDPPQILVVAEHNWMDQLVAAEKHMIAPPLSQRNIRWSELLNTYHRLRLPDDFPGMVLNDWHPPSNFTLLVCHSIEAQDTLRNWIGERNYGAKRNEQWLTLLPDEVGLIENRLWISNIERILHAPIERKRLLEFLELARHQSNTPAIVLTSLILPHQWVTDEQPWSTKDMPDIEERVRWLRLLACIDVRSVGAFDYEQRLGQLVRGRHALPRANREAEYELWWQYSTQAEQVALAALAHEGLINPYDRVVIRSLIARGLIFQIRTLQFCDRGFGRFVKHRLPATELHRYADEVLRNSSWGAARGPLFATLALLGYGVMALGGGTLETILGLVTSIGASVPALLNVVQMLRRDNSA